MQFFYSNYVVIIFMVCVVDMVKFHSIALWNYKRGIYYILHRNFSDKFILIKKLTIRN